MKRRVLSLLMAISLLITMVPVSVFAAGPAEPIGQTFGKIEPVTQINPLYEDVITEDEVAKPVEDAQSAVAAVDASGYADTYEDAAGQLREGMKNRQASVSVYYKSDGLDTDSDIPAIFNESLTHTGIPTEGDYLKWVWGSYSCGGSYYIQDGVYYLTYTYSIVYYDSAEQESALDAAVDELLQELNPQGSDYEKIRAVYDYMCENITYDHGNLDNDEYKLKYTAYAALVNKTAVCQGYAVLLYRLALEMGIDARVIAGSSKGDGEQDHGWNIVELNGKYYNADSTWDAGYTTYSWFLQSEASFTRNYTMHIRSTEYDTAQFHAAYPMAEADYDPSSAPEDPGSSLEALIVGGVNALETTSGEGWSFDPATDTLKLTEAQITAENYGIYAEGNLTIHAEEGTTNTISGGYAGIYVTGDLNISGNGGMEISAAAEYAACVQTVGHGPYGIFASGALSFSDTLVSAVSDDIGIFSGADMSIVNSTVTGTGGLIGIDSYGKLVIDAAEVTGNSADLATEANMNYDDGRMPFGIASRTENITISNGSKVGAASDFVGIISGGALCVTDSELDAAATVIAVYGYGVVSFEGDSTIHATALLRDDQTEFYGSDYAAIHSNEGIVIGEGLISTGGVVGTMDGYYRFVDDNGGNVKEITIESFNTVASGTCGENLTWLLDEEGTLTISGSGAMTTFSYNTAAPWSGYKEQIKTIVIGEDVTSLSKYAFYDCTAVESIVFRATAMADLTSGNYVFHRVGQTGEGISVVIGHGVTAIPAYLFCPYNNSTYAPKILSVSFEEGSVCTKIGNYAFSRCAAMTDIQLPEGLTTIGSYAFYECSGLTSISIPESVTAINNDAFYQCTGLTAVHIANLEAWCAISFGLPGSNPLYHAAKLYLNGALITELTLPQGLDVVKPNSFCNLHSLTAVTIPDGVIKIDTGAFANCINLVDVNLPDTLQEIGSEAFVYCRKMERIDLPEGMIGIYPAAFAGCVSLEEIHIPNTVQAIGSAAFGECTSLKHISFPASATYMEPGMFLMGVVESLDVDSGNPTYYCEDSVMFVHDNEMLSITDPVLFSYPPRKAGTAYTIADGIVGIMDYAFAYNNLITEVTIPASVQAVGYGAFGECSNLTKLTFLGDVPTFGNDVFYNVPHVTICYPEGNENWLEFIAGLEASLGGNLSFEGIDTSGGSGEGGSGEGGSGEGGSGEGGSGEGGSGEGGQTATSGTCGQNVAWNLDDNGKLTISAQTAEEAQQVNTAVNSARFGNGSDSGFRYVSGFGYGSCGNGMTEKSAVAVYAAVEYAMEDYTSAEETPWYALRDRITAVEILDGVTHVGSYAFAGCENLGHVSIGNNVSSIGAYAFAECSLNLTFTGDAPEISENAFSGATVNIRIPEGNETWTEDVMQNYGGTITWVPYEVEGTDPTDPIDPTDPADPNVVASGTCGEKATWTLSEDGVLTICGEGAMTDYDRDSDTPWYAYQSQIVTVVINEGITTVGNDAFNSCSNLTNATLPDGIASIGRYAFYDTNLNTVTIPDTVTAISHYAFSSCANLSEITIPDSVISMGQGVFCHDAGLRNVTIGDGITTITEFAFYGCSSLGSVTIPDSVTTIESCAFKECTSLSSVTIPHTVTDIAGGAFSYCPSLSSVVIPESITILNIGLFEGCSGLQEVTIPDSVTVIDQAVFMNCTSLSNIQIPSNVTTIGIAALAGTGLTSVTIPSSVTSIESQVFSTCSALDEIIFCGDAPSFGSSVFLHTTTTAYYPAGNETWTEDVMQNYGGTITWEPYGEVEEPIVITAQPVNYVGLVGDIATFSVTAVGEGLTYQWYYFDNEAADWKKASGGTSDTLSVEFKSYRVDQEYRCEITDADGNTVTTDIVRLVAQVVDLVIVTQPVDYVGSVNDELSFTVEATGNGLQYQWYYSDDAGATWKESGTPGFDTATLRPILRAYRDGYQYYCRITDIFGNTVDSNVVTATVKTSDVTISEQPVSVTNGILDQLHTFQVTASGENLEYRWEYSDDGGETWQDSWNQGYNTDTLTVRLYAYRSGYLYRCKITSGLKTVVYTDAVELKLQAPSAAIVTQPTSVAVVAGKTIAFKVEATGTDLTYQWYRSNDNGVNWTKTYLGDYNTDTLSFAANASRAALYKCQITDGSGKIIWSEPVKLTILSAELQILSQPESVTCANGATATFTVEAQGDGLKYQWYASADGGESWTLSYLTGYNTANFSFVVNATRAAKLYKCVITDAAGNTVETNAVSVTIG